MRDLHKVSKGVFLKAVSSVLVVLLGLVASVFINRHYGKDAYGLLILVYIVINFCWSFSDLGANRTLNRLIPQAISSRKIGGLNSLIKVSLLFQICGITIFSALMYFYSNFVAVSIFHRSQLAQLIRLGVLMFAATSMIEFSSQFYQAFQDWFRDSILNIIYPALYLVLVVAGVSYLGISVAGVIIMNAFAAILTILIAIIILPLGIKSLLAERTTLLDYIKSGKKILNFGTPLLANNLSFFLLSWFDKAMIGRFRPLEELTFYYIAYTFLNGIMTLFKTLVTVFMPYLSGLAGASEGVIKDKFELMFRWFLHITILISLIAFFLIEPLIVKLYGSNYSPAVVAFRMLLLLFISRGLANLPNIFLTNIYGQAKQTVGVITILVVANIVLNSLLIPLYGYKGAIMAATLAYSVYWLSMVVWVKPIRNKMPFKAIFKTFSIIILVFFLYFILQQIGIRSFYVYAFLMPAFYLLLSKLFKETTKRDILIIKEILRVLVRTKKINPEPPIV